MKFGKCLLAFFSFLLIFINTYGRGCYALENEQKTYSISDVPFVSQTEIGLVSGCEAATAAMLLNFWGYSISPESFYDDVLLHKNWNLGKDGKIYAADPSAAYVGDARKKSGINCGFGCYAPVLIEAMKKVIDHKKHKIINLTGLSPEDICKNYVNKGYPVLAFATMGMLPTKPTSKWRVSYVNKYSKLKLGDTFTWLANEHCLLFIGYNKNSYIFNDPLKKSPRISYPKKLFERRYKEMGSQALTIVPCENDKKSGVPNV